MRDRFRRARRSACRAARRTRPFPDRPGSPRRGRGRRRRTPAPRGCAAGSPAPARSATPGRYGRRPPMPSITSASAPERTSRLRQHQRGGEADQLARRRPSPRAPRRRAACRRPARHGRPAPRGRRAIRSSSCGCMVIRLTPNGLSVSAWVAGDLGGQQVRAHRAAGDHAEAAGVGDRGDQMPLAHPAHRAAHDGVRGSRGTPCRAPTAGRARARAASAPSRRAASCQAASRP